jgi:hypothetical protein
MGYGVNIETTRKDIRETFTKWGIRPENYMIEWADKGLESVDSRFKYGVSIRYFRNKVWQTVTCMDYGRKDDNLRQCYLLIDRLRIAEHHGVQYQNLAFTKEVAKTTPVEVEKDRRESLLEAYDIVGGSPDDPIDLIMDLYRKKATYYHPDKGGDKDRFVKLTKAYELICTSRGVKP